MEELFQKLYEHNHVVGELGGKKFFLVLISPTSFMVALENDGCFVVNDIAEPVYPANLMGAGFDLLTAPAVTKVVEECRAWLGRDRMATPKCVLLEKKDD